jgi:ABC-type sugar transport system ATPase subunit
MISRQELHNHVKVLADELGVSIDVKARINDLGAGERQMVDILKSLRSSGSVLLLDEPTAALSQRERQTLFGLIRQLKSQGLSILFVSHQLDEVFEVCDRIVCLRDGGVVSNRLIGESHIDQVIADIAGEENLNNFSRSVNSFPGETAIQIVSTKDGEVGLNVKTGEVVGLAGAVGSGCTELIEFISGSGKSPGRRLTVRGGAANYKNAAEARGDHIVLLPEKRAEKGVWSSLTLRENVSIGTLDKVSRGGFVSRRREHELVSSLTKSLMIKTPSLNTQISALSGGNQQKAVFARVLGQAADPQGAVFCFDEPTEGVDVRTKPEIAEQICRLSDQGAAVIVASSDLDELINMTDRIYVLREGIVVEEFEAQLHNRDAIVSRMLSQGEDRAVDAPRQGQ